jgi:hypothetical protein
MRRVLIALIGACLLATAVGSAFTIGHQTASPMPEVSPHFSVSDRPAFVLEIKSTPTSPLPGFCRIRLDGLEEPLGYTLIGPLPPAVAPGDSWRERIVLVPVDAKAWRTNGPLGIAMTRDIPVNLSPGRHVIAFACRTVWSTPVSFYWGDQK